MIDLLISLVIFVVAVLVIFYVVQLIMKKAQFDAELQKIIYYVLGGLAIVAFLGKFVRPLV